MRNDNAYQRTVHAPYNTQRRTVYAALAGDPDDPVAPPPDPDRPDLARIARRLARCCQAPQVIQSSETGQIRVSQGRCRSRCCPYCARMRAREARQRLESRLQTLDDPRFITLTIRSTDDPLHAQLQRLRAAFTKLRRSALWRHRVDGGAYVVEITWNPERRQWHPHLHCVVDGRYIPQPLLAKQWYLATGDSRIVDIRACHSRREAAAYLTGYITKAQDPSGLPQPQIREWAESLHGARMIQSFGSLHRQTHEPEPPPTTEQWSPIAPLAPLVEAAHDADPDAAHLLGLLSTAIRQSPPDPEDPRYADWAAYQRDCAQQLREWINRRLEPHFYPPTSRTDRCVDPTPTQPDPQLYGEP